MTDFLAGYTGGWEVRAVNTGTWADSARMTGIQSINVKTDCTDSVPLLETGSLTLSDPGDFSWAWLRIYLVAEQVGYERHPIATLLFERSKSHWERHSTTLTIEGRSVLQPAADRVMERGGFAVAGEDGAARAGRLISECTPAPVNVEGYFFLSSDIVFDLGISHLEAAWKLLEAADWCIQIDGDGTINIREKPKRPDLELSLTTAGLLLPGIDDDHSIIDVPNRYLAYDEQADEVAIATNEDPDSEAGYPQRGRWVDMVDESPTLIDGEPLEAYAKRRLAEESTYMRKYSYTREFWPGVHPYSLVRATLVNNGIEGDLRVLSQDINCGHGVTIAETAGMEVKA